ncbi:type II/IV secretion system protein [bacterium]|nr:MAG: type II/IV secretion system protein [bacterium]
MDIGEGKLKQILVNPGILTEKQFEIALKLAGEKKLSLAKILVDEDFISEEHLGQLIAEEMGVLFINLRKTVISDEVLKIIPQLVAKSQQVISFRMDKEGLRVAMANPQNSEMARWLKKKTGKNIIIYYATPKDIKTALSRYRAGFREHFESLIKRQLGKASRTTKPEDAPVIRVVDSIIDYAYENRASDIHMEPREEKVVVRYRIDGILHDVIYLPVSFRDPIIMRIKVLAKMKTDEHMSAQDGKFRKKFGEDTFDIRVSVVPIVNGEKIVMRILSGKSRAIDLNGLGFDESDLERMQKIVKKSYGMILSAGPTGCGKTTTLYAILQQINTPEVNISTIEDPVEYGIDKINQIQVNKKTGLTFSTGLRAIVRQDPDIIMVGEIRDEETAKIAINSAMTGHLVLSTIHTNNAATAFPRLMDMGIKAFLVASSVNIVVAQRLVRRVCVNCRESYTLDINTLKRTLPEELFSSLIKGQENAKEVRVYRGKGCKECGFTGYRGRQGIFEVLEIQENIRELIMQDSDADEIEKQAIKNGMTRMIQDGARKIIKGITTIEEVMRVIQ